MIRLKFIFFSLMVTLVSSVTINAQSAVPSMQDLRIDSLKRLFDLTIKDEERLIILQKICWSYAWSSPESTLSYARNGIRLAEQLEKPESQISFLTSMAQAYSGKGNLAEALKVNFRALEIAEKNEDEDQRAWCYASIGSIYYYTEDFQHALLYFLKTKLYPNAYSAKEKLYAGLIGETYFHLNQLDSAMIYIERSYDLQIKDKEHWAVPYLYKGKLTEISGRYQEAIPFFHASIKNNVTETDSVKAYLAIANNFEKRNLVDSGIFYASLAYSLADDVELYRYTIDASQILFGLYRTKKQYDSVFKYQDIMVAARDSLFSTKKLYQLQSLTFEEAQRRQDLEKEKEKLRGKIKMYGLLAGLLALAIISAVLFRSNRFKQKTNVLLLNQRNKIEEQRAAVEKALQELKSTQSQLIQSEKMASLGELTAGIAHEIQNPLNFVNNFSELSNELIDEMNAELSKGNFEEAKAISADIRQNLEKINHHGKRADAIVKGMLQHSRAGNGKKEPTDINALCDEYLRLAYHGLRAKDKSFNATMKTDFDASIGKVNIIPQDIGRVVLNLITNAFYAVNEKTKQGIAGYEPTVEISTTHSPLPGRGVGGEVSIKVKDNGSGIPPHFLDKIFQPFFTTKPTGQGTGLGLSMSYDIVTKGHGGELLVDSREGEYTLFTIILPL